MTTALPLPDTRTLLRSAFAWGGSFAWMSGVFTATAALSPILPWQRTHRWIGGPGMAFCLRLTGSSVEVLSDPRFDPERRSVFCQNHVNLMDAHAAAAAIPHAVCGLMNWWHFKLPVYGWLMSISQGIPVPPKRPGRSREIAEAARERAARGLSILVYPEGHRTLDGAVRKFRSGVFRMAREAGLPVVPLATWGMFDMMRKGSPLIRPSRIRVFRGPQVETAGLSDDELEALIDGVQAVVAAFAENGEIPHELIDALPQ